MTLVPLLVVAGLCFAVSIALFALRERLQGGALPRGESWRQPANYRDSGSGAFRAEN